MQQIDGQMVVKDFFDNFFNIMLVQLFMQQYVNKDEALSKIDEIYKLSEVTFQPFLQSIATNDMTGYLELKKVIGQTFTNIRNNLIQGYESNENDEVPVETIVN